MSSPVKISWKSELWSIIVLIIAAVSSVYFYLNFPEKVASHWNFQGQVDGYSSRGFGAFFFVGLLVFIYVLFLVLPYFDPKKERYAEFAKVYGLFRNLILTVMAIIYLMTGVYNLGYPINMGITTAFIIGLMMIAIGNYMGKIKKNWFLGIRTPWTLSSEDVWNKTHRVGGWLFMLFGACIIIAPWLPETIGTAIFIGGAVVMVLGTFVYSYLLYRQEQKQKK